MRRILTIKGLLIFAAVAIALTILTMGLVLAGTMITRDQPALVKVIGQLSVDETLVLCPDVNGKPDCANPITGDKVLNFGQVNLDAFGTVAGGPPRIPLYVLSKAGTDIKLEVKESGDKTKTPFIEVLFGPRGQDMKPAPKNATKIEVGKIFTADLGMQFTQAPGTGDKNFTINFNAEAIVLGRDVAIACDSGSFICANSNESAFLAKQVLGGTGLWNEVKVVDGSEIDTAAELANFGVVIVGGHYYDKQQDYTEYDDALQAWVQQGGSVIFVGYASYQLADWGLQNAPIGQLVPVIPMRNDVCCGFTINIIPSSDALTKNMASFQIPYNMNYANDSDVKQGARVLARDSWNNGPAIIAWEVGNGKVAYLTTPYLTRLADWPQNKWLLDGSYPGAKRAFIQAIMWGSGMDTAGAPNAPSAFAEQAFPSIDSPKGATPGITHVSSGDLSSGQATGR